MNDQKSFLTQLKDYFHYLTECHFKEKHGNENCKDLMLKYRNAFDEFYSKNLSLMPNDLAKRHGINSIFVLAFDKALSDKQLSFDDLKEQILSVYRAMLSSLLEQQKGQLAVSENPWKAFVEMVRKGNESLYDNEFFSLQMVEDSDTCFGFDLHRCIYFEILNKNGRPDLGPILCEYDWLLAEAVEQWITFDRLEAIALEGKKCTFRYFPND
ncbi:MAG: hypothetical protein FK730_01720 [Asgard group archaeon]|nr:hypothetical protein [Asgard group archaeon]